MLMTTLSAPARITPHDLLSLGDEKLFELVDGQLIEKQMGYLASKTTAIFISRFLTFVEGCNAGDVLSEQTFQCFEADNGDRVRRPDVAFIAAGRLPSDVNEGHLYIKPDIAVEVVSPSDKIYELDEKLEDYRSAGVTLVWVINPNSRTVRVYRPDHTVTELTETDTLKGEAVLPEFTVKVSDLLPSKKA